jgi:membrane protease YdiL (CAAX protease family)
VFFGGAGLGFGALTLAFALAIRLIHGKRFADVVGAWRWSLVARGATLWLAVSVIAGVVDYLLEPHGFRLTASGATLTLAFWALPSLAIQTFAEEFVFRGYLTQALLLLTRRPIVTALASGLLFGMLHIFNGWPQAASATVFGVVTALIAIRTGGIAFTFGLHVANNVFLAVIVVSANDVFRGAPGLITQSTPNLMWVDSVVPFVAFAAALWVAGVRPGWAAETVSRRPS